MGGRTFICNPGSSFITPGTEADLCRCGHVRAEHWWGGGNCGAAYKNGNGCRCEYFRGRPAAALSGSQENERRSDV